MTRLALCLAEYLYELCVAANVDANEDYAFWVGSNRPQEDYAWDDCIETSRAADEALDCLMTVECYL